MSELTHIVCPGCNAINRLPASRLADKPVCGGCKKPLFSGHPLELNSATFASHISKSDLPVLVDFWAPWCGPCKMMGPAFAQAAEQLEPYFRLAKVNTEAEQGISAQFGIRSIPTLILFKQGREIARQAGAMTTTDIINWVRSVSH